MVGQALPAPPQAPGHGIPVQPELVQMGARLSDLENEVTGLRSDVETLRGEVQGLRAGVEVLRAGVEGLRQEIVIPWVKCLIFKKR